MPPKKQGRSRSSRSARKQRGGLFTFSWNRPSDLIADVMAGKKRIDEVPEAIQSAVRLPIHHEALKILEIKKELRKDALHKLPETIQSLVEAEVRRMFDVQLAQRRSGPAY